jgi:ribonuclease III
VLRLSDLTIYIPSFITYIDMDLIFVQNQLNYTFQDERLLRTALVHRSYMNERDRDQTITEHNERLEFLGDAVLELVVTEYLFTHLSESEGYMTALRSSLVNYKIIGEVGIEIGLENNILLSKGEKEELGKARLTIVADSTEAVIGAMYLDGGVEPVKQFIKTRILSRLEDIVRDSLYKDAKTQLQEYTQKIFRITPTYKTIGSEGKDHEKVFYIAVYLGNNEIIGHGEGRSKQDAETMAAKAGMELLLSREEKHE